MFGHKPSHIDTHHTLHIKDKFKPVYFKLAQKYDIPVRGGLGFNNIKLDNSIIFSNKCIFSWGVNNEGLQRLDVLL